MNCCAHLIPLISVLYMHIYANIVFALQMLCIKQIKNPLFNVCQGQRKRVYWR